MYKKGCKSFTFKYLSVFKLPCLLHISEKMSVSPSDVLLLSLPTNENMQKGKKKKKKKFSAPQMHLCS